MKIGIFTKWKKCDATFAAIAVARLFERMGHDFEIIPAGWRSKTVDMRWDNRVSPVLNDDNKLLRVLASKQMIVWTEMATPSFIYWLINHRVPIINVLYTGWDTIRYEDEMAINSMDHIFAPTDLQVDTFKERWGYNKIQAVPYNCWLPPVLKTGFYRRGELHMFMSLFGSQLHRVDMQSVTAVIELMRKYPYLHLTIAASKGLHPAIQRGMYDLVRAAAPRLRFLPDSPWHEQQVLMGHADLTLWPAVMDGHGIIPRTSLCLGTPVLGFKYHPATVYVRDKLNGVLVDSPITHNWMGAEIVKPDWDAYRNAIEDLVTAPEQLLKYTMAARFDSEACHKVFIDRWSRVIPS